MAALTLVGTAVGLVVARRAFIAAHRPLGWAAAALVAAVVLDPVVDRLAVHLHRVPAVLLTLVAVGGLSVGTAYLVFHEVEAALNHLQEVAPDAARTIELRDDKVGQLARDFHLRDRVTSASDALDARVTGGGDVLRSTAGTAPTYLVSAILTVFLMTYGPRIAKSALEQDPDAARRARIAEIVGPAVNRARSAVITSVGMALLVGLAVAGTATALDLPAPSAIGFAAGVLSLFPFVGLTIGAIPLLLVTLGFRSLSAAVILFVVVLVVQVLDSLMVRPRLAVRSVDVGLVVPWVVALVGYSVYGVGGAAYGTAYAVFGLAILDRLDHENRARTEASADLSPA
jgi:predicted PurR-regulated permease PerM